VFGEERGTDAELMEVKAGADPAGVGPSAWRRSRGDEERTRGTTVTQCGTSGPQFSAASLGDEVHTGSDEGSAQSGSSGTRVWWSGTSAVATASGARHVVEKSDGRASGEEKTDSIVDGL
jgi:hypothetical protein